MGGEIVFMNINLREEATTQYISFYRGYLEDVKSLNNKVMDILNEVMQQSKYDKLQNMISQIIDAYMDTIVNNIKNGVFHTWQESEGSLRACLKMYRAGDAADEVCVQIEQQMEDLMQDILKIEKADLIVTERPIVSEEGLEQLEDICRTAQTEIQNLKTEYASQVSTKKSDNDIYGTLRPLIEGVAANMEAFFEASLNSFVELHEFIRGIWTFTEEMQNNGDKSVTGSSSDSIGDFAELKSPKTKDRKEDEFIFIAGSYFDVANGVDSRYVVFRSFLNKKIGKNDKYKILIENKEFDKIIKEMYQGELKEEFISRLQLLFTLVDENSKELDNEKYDEWKSLEDSLNFTTFLNNVIYSIEGDGLCASSSLEYLYNTIDKDVKEILNGLFDTLSKSLRDFKRVFIEWIKEDVEPQIKDLPNEKSNKEDMSLLKNVIKKIDEQNGLFLTFNYTDVLERIYGIHKVEHIHGIAQSDNVPQNTEISQDSEPLQDSEELILGFGEKNVLNEYKVGDDFKKIESEIELMYEKGEWIKWSNISRNYNPDIVAHVGYLFNSILRKKCGLYMRESELFSNDKLCNLNNICIYGWSVGEADMPYLIFLMKMSKKQRINVYISDHDFKRDDVKKRIIECAEIARKDTRDIIKPLSKFEIGEK